MRTDKLPEPQKTETGVPPTSNSTFGFTRSSVSARRANNSRFRRESAYDYPVADTALRLRSHNPRHDADHALPTAHVKYARHAPRSPCPGCPRRRPELRRSPGRGRAFPRAGLVRRFACGTHRGLGILYKSCFAQWSELKTRNIKFFHFIFYGIRQP